MAYKSQSSAGPTAATLTIPAPSPAISVGDHLTIWVLTDNQNEVFTPPSGFTAVSGTPITDTADSQTLGVWTKIADSTDAAAANFVVSTSLQEMIGGMIVHSGRHATTPLHRSAHAIQNTAQASPWTMSTSFSSATSVAGCDIVAIAGSDVTGGGDVVHSSSTLTIRHDKTDTGFMNGAAGTLDNVASGDTGSQSIVGTLASITSGWGYVILALAPSGGDITVTPSGMSMTMSQGAPSVIASGSVVVTPTGMAMTMAQGTFVTEGDPTLIPTGMAMTMALGTPTVNIQNSGSNPSVTPASMSMAMSIGSPLVIAQQNVTITPVGMQMSMNLNIPTQFKGKNARAKHLRLDISI
jgi:hypothetical protein